MHLLLPLSVLSLWACSASGEGYRVTIRHTQEAVRVRRGLLASTASNLLNPMNQNNIAFQVDMNIQLGSNGQTLTSLVVDTGSSPLWVADATCVLNKAPTPPCATSLFTSAQSSSFKIDNFNTPFFAQYGDGTTVTGPYVQDTVAINGLSYNNFVFGLAKNKTVPAGIGGGTGIIGFAPQENGNSGAILNNFIADPQLTTKQVSFYFPTSLSANGELYIGGADTNLYTGSPVWVPINLQNYWSVGANSLVFASNAAGVASSAGGTAIIDTGSSFLLGPAADIAAICSFLGLNTSTATGGCTPVCCNTPAICAQNGFANLPNVANMPHFYLNFGSAASKIAINVADSFYVPFQTSNAGVLTCAIAVSVLTPAFAGEPAWIVGAAAIRQYYTIFDFSGYNPSTASGTGMVGFATKVQNVAVTQAPAFGGAGGTPNVVASGGGSAPHSSSVRASVSLGLLSGVIFVAVGLML